MARKWWQEPSYPESAWTPADRAAARKDGWRSSSPSGDLALPRLDDVRPFAVDTPKPVAISDSQVEASAARDRRRKANKALEDAGVRPQPWV